jgi:hypothetical protein
VSVGAWGWWGGMSRSVQGAGRAALAITAAGRSSSAAQPGDSGFEGRAALGLIGLGVVGHVLRNRRFYEGMAVAAIVVGALRRMGQENTASTMQRLVAVNKRAIQREVHQVEHKAKRQARAVKTSRQMARSAPSKNLASKMDQP